MDKDDHIYPVDLAHFYVCLDYVIGYDVDYVLDSDLDYSDADPDHFDTSHHIFCDRIPDLDYVIVISSLVHRLVFRLLLHPPHVDVSNG